MPPTRCRELEDTPKVMSHAEVPAIAVAVLWLAGCSGADTPSSASPVTGTAAFQVTFGQNPVPFRDSGCNGSVPQGWYTDARIQETAGVAFTPATLTQKLDGAPAAILNESFASRFGACPGNATVGGIIAANGSVCGSVGVCTTGTYSSYQFEVSGTDANGHTVTFASPVLQLGAR
jgi:hypothetical protein